MADIDELAALLRSRATRQLEHPEWAFHVEPAELLALLDAYEAEKAKGETLAELEQLYRTRYAAEHARREQLEQVGWLSDYGELKSGDKPESWSNWRPVYTVEGHNE